jgi:single-stranded-DNA-specific exonuclease
VGRSAWAARPTAQLTRRPASVHKLTIMGAVLTATPSTEAPATPSAQDLGRALGLSQTVAEVLARRGYTEVESARRFLEPRLAHLTPPDQMADRGLAAERIARAVRAGERVCVYGDYDCDGITATAIMSLVLRALGGEVVPLLASRFDGGYGVSPAAKRRIVESGARLLITADCGSSDHEVLASLGARGIEAIVIDHHLLPEEKLPVAAFLNPHRPDCGYPYKNLASCGLVLSIAAAVRSELGVKLDLRELLDLVALGTVADLAPLDGDNRVLARAGLEMLRQARRPGVRAMSEQLRFDGTTPISADDVAFRFAPRINAPGRLATPDLALELLLARSLETARPLAAEIEQVTQRRRELQDKMLEEAILEVESAGWAECASLVVGRPGWNHGLAGIVAGQLVARYSRPAIVIGFDHSGRGRGSARGPKGARLYQALQAAGDLVERFGGHQAAAGLELRLERLEALRARFEEVCSKASCTAIEPEDADSPVPLCPGDDPARVLEDLSRVEPCGAGNPQPRFLIEGELLGARAVRGGHLKLDLSLASGARVSGFGSGLGHRASSLAQRIVTSGTLRWDRWRGGRAVEIAVDALWPA